MNATKIFTIVCWVISALVLVGLTIWFLTGSIFGGWINNFGSNNILGTGFSIQSLTGPFDNRYSEAVNTTDLHSIRIDWVAGEVTIIPHNGNDIQITESAQRSLGNNEQMRISTNDGTLNIRFREQGAFGIINMPRKNLEVLVPHGLSEDLRNLSVSTTSGSVYTRDFNATTFNVSSVSATVDVSGIVSNTIDISTTSGTITATSVRAGRLNAGSVSGAVDISEAYVTALDISTTSGRTIAEGEFERVDVSTVSGNTTIRSRVVPAAMDISSVSGAMDIYIPNLGEIAVNHSAVSGRFSSAIPVIMQGRAAAYSFSSVSGNTNIHLWGE